MAFILYLVINVKAINGNIVLAKYTYNINENVIKLSRDTRIANYVITYSEPVEYTNQDIKVSVTFDKEIEYLFGFNKIDEYNFEKIYSQNVNENVNFIDYSGNKSSIEIKITNIDKEPPKIIGIEEENNLKVPFKLDYTDNIGVKKIEVKRYVQDLDYRVLDHFYDDNSFYGIDVLDNTIKATIIGRPLGTEKYRYYLNNELKAITDNISYEFKNLTAMTKYTVKIEAIGKNDEVIDVREKVVTTQCFSKVEESKNSNLGIITLKGIYPIVKSIQANVYSDENPNDVTYVQIPYDSSKGEFTFVFNRETFKYTNPQYGYKIHFYFFDENRKEVSVLPFNLKFGAVANEFILDVKDVYNIVKKGTYKIVVEDIAGNVTEKYITIK